LIQRPLAGRSKGHRALTTFALAQIPAARVKIYSDSAYGFLFQQHADFAVDVEALLSGPH